MLPFSGIRVIDFTHVIAGPFCAYQLAVLGADVIKIESPHAPDMVREDGAPDSESNSGVRSMFAAQNANKRTIAVDLKTPEGCEIALELMRDADVVVENYRSGALAALGLGYDDVRQANPDIIYCSLTGFGQTGPKAGHTAYDNVIQAFSGLMASTGTEETGPVKVGPPVLDYSTGAQAAYAIAAALFQRARTGEGQYIDIAMLDAAFMLMSANLTYRNVTGQCMPLSGNDSLAKPGYCCFPTANGLLMLGAYTVKQHIDMWQVLGNEQRAQQLEGKSQSQLSELYAEDKTAIANVLLQKPADEWEVLMNAAKVPAARVRTVDEAMRHPQVASRSVLQELEGAGSAQPIPVAAFRYAEAIPEMRSIPAAHGQYTREILTELGYPDDRIDQLEAQGVIHTA